MAPRLVVLLVGVASLAMAACTGDDTATEADTGGTERESSMREGADLLARLRDGGLTIVIRHAETDRSRPDDPVVDLNDCATQRNLSDQGRADARTIGTAVDRLSIPIGAVWASPYCRGKDTAELAFDRFEVVDGLERLYPERDEQADRRLNRLIRQRAPRAGEPNLIIAGHGVYPSVLSPPVTLGEGEAALYARAGNAFTLVDRLEPGEWAELASGENELRGGAARVPESVVVLEGPRGAGSAFRVALPGILVTSAQLVADAREVTVTQPDGRRHTARVLGRRHDVDIAALRVDDDSGLPPLHSGMGRAEASIGDRAFAIGASGSVTVSALRSLNQPATLDGGGTVEMISVDADVPPAGLGGPLVNEDGNVLGVLTGAADGPGGLAIPVATARTAALGIVGDS